MSQLANISCVVNNNSLGRSCTRHLLDHQDVNSKCQAVRTMSLLLLLGILLLLMDASESASVKTLKSYPFHDQFSYEVDDDRKIHFNSLDQ